MQLKNIYIVDNNRIRHQTLLNAYVKPSKMYHDKP